MYMLECQNHDRQSQQSRPENRSAYIAAELSRLITDIAALSEVRLAGKVDLLEHGINFILYLSEKPSTERRTSDVGFLVNNLIAFNLVALPTCHSARTISIRLSLECNQHVTLISVYAPTHFAVPAYKNSIHSDLYRYLDSTPANNKALIHGDFNSNVGIDTMG